MSLRQIFTPLCLIGVLGMANAAQAQSAGDAVMDAAGRVYGNAMPAPAMPAPSMVMSAAPAMPQMAAPAAQIAPAGAPGWNHAGWEQAKADWLYECRRRYPAGKKSTTLGAVLGGVVGGVLGNRIAGRGDRTVGTVAGAVLGGVAGGAIGNSADRSRSRDYCESYLDDYLSRQQAYGHGQPGMTYGYVQQQVTMMVPVMMMQQHAAVQPQRECKETIVTEEWVPVRAKRRVIYKTVTVPDKRVRIVPDKRVRTY
ncbi:glycine zipper 2TM domain-containing protein [Novosphingobium sp. B 225]|uniref:glycine zipper 2TM domain-containing protein n=1 Tax=Novosphingobium sp. B 225 TaxID=1961849 RepID=UPI000B4B0C47|nr:glycine zipper 2TM domain-containing protein [Novosphingobium sp. B 225]